MIQPLQSMEKVIRAQNTVVLDEKNPHIRNTRDGTVTNLDVNSGVCTVDYQFSAGRDSDRPKRFPEAWKTGSGVQRWRIGNPSD